MTGEDKSWLRRLNLLSKTLQNITIGLYSTPFLNDILFEKV